MNRGRQVETSVEKLRLWVSRGALEEEVTVAGSWCSREMSPSHQLLIEGCWPELAKSVTRFSKSRFFLLLCLINQGSVCPASRGVSLFGHGHLE